MQMHHKGIIHNRLWVLVAFMMRCEEWRTQHEDRVTAQEGLTRGKKHPYIDDPYFVHASYVLGTWASYVPLYHVELRRIQSCVASYVHTFVQAQWTLASQLATAVQPVQLAGSQLVIPPIKRRLLVHMPQSRHSWPRSHSQWANPPHDLPAHPSAEASSRPPSSPYSPALPTGGWRPGMLSLAPGSSEPEPRPIKDLLVCNSINQLVNHSLTSLNSLPANTCPLIPDPPTTTSSPQINTHSSIFNSPYPHTPSPKQVKDSTHPYSPCELSKLADCNASLLARLGWRHFFH